MPSGKFLSSMYNLYDPLYQKIIIGFLWMYILLGPCMIYLSNRKIKEIKNPKKYSSYNKLTVQMLNVLMCGLSCTLINDILSLVFIYTDREIIRNQSNMQNQFLAFFMDFLVNLERFFSEFSVCLQAFEWLSILSVILL